MSELGFGGVALDYIEGPDPVLNMLCHDCHVHSTPMSSREFSPLENQRCEQVRLGTWIAGKSVFQHSSRYGASTTKVVPINPARVYKVQPVDVNLKRQKERRIAELNAELEELQNDLEGRGERLIAVREQARQTLAERTAVEKEKKTRQEACAKYNRLRAELGAMEGKLQELADGGPPYRARMRELDARLDRAATARAQAVLDHAVRRPHPCRTELSKFCWLTR